MKKIYSLAWLLLCSITLLKANDYEKAWQALDNNNIALAKELLVKISHDPKYRTDALATLIILEDCLERGSHLITEYHDPIMQMDNLQPYFFALWFNDACLGAYQKMDSVHRAHLEYILSHDNFNGSMQAAATYFKSLDEFLSYNSAKSSATARSIDAIRNWEMTGPFDNISGSGFDKDFGALAHPQDDAVFTSYNNMPVKWFVPAQMDDNSWIFVKTPFPETAGLVYAQSFVQAGAAQDVLLCLGSAGSLKVWVNDKLLFSEPQERVTALDTYKVPCHLNAGYNRILVQVGDAEINDPNFIVRLTDNNYHAVKGLVAYSSYHPYTKDISTTAVTPLPHFAENYFSEKIKSDPQNLVNYLLLGLTYLRNQKTDDVKKLFAPLLKAHPHNLLVLKEYYSCLAKEGNTIEAQEYLEKIRLLYPHTVYALAYQEEQLQKEKKYTEALLVFDTLQQQLGIIPPLLSDEIAIKANQNNLTELLPLIKKSVALFPGYVDFTTYLYNYYKKIANDQKAAIKALEDYNNRAFNYNIAKTLSDEYIEDGQTEKGIALKKKSLSILPYADNVCNDLVRYYFKQTQFDSCIHYLKALSLDEPYKSTPYSDIAACYEQLKDTAHAIEYYKKALSCNPSVSEYRDDMRELQKKPDLESYFPKLDVDKYIAQNLAHPYDSLHHYYYVFDVRNILVYPEGTDEQEIQTAIYINDDKGIEDFNSVTLNYNDNFQELNIIEADVMKKDGSKVPADINDNQMVFTKLNPGDLIYYHYKIRNYGIGRMGREFWDKFYFSAYAPTKLCGYNILVADQIPFKYKFFNDEKEKPDISKHENYTLYSWILNDIPALKDEPYMPPSIDVGKVLHVSTISSWSDIVQWYSDISKHQSDDNYDVDVAYQNIFPQGNNNFTDQQKANKIYQFITSNISYSSVPFRQSAYIPQKASKTLITRTGDCKDMSALFVALAKKAGLRANLVLVNTRDNGQHAMELPSMEFNHCIAKYFSGTKFHYVELTDPDLPFSALPADLHGAQILNIPYSDGNFDAQQITTLQENDACPDEIVRKMQVTVNGDDIAVQSNLNMYGALTSGFRDKYKNEADDKIKNKVKDGLDNAYGKSVDLINVKLKGVDILTDSVQEQTNFEIKNEVIDVNDLHMLKPHFIDIVANMDPFSVKDRQYPVEYNKYENAEKYITTMEIDLPEHATLTQIPKDINLTFDEMHYQLTYKKLGDDKVLIKREFTTVPWKNIAAGDYNKFEDFFQAIVNGESKYIVYQQVKK